MSAMIGKLLRRPVAVSNLHHINTIRFVLPLSLFLIAAGFEFSEHRIAGKPLSLSWMGLIEITIFGLVGPAITFVVLTYIVALLQEILGVSGRVALLNQDLERLVTQRTAALQASNDELAQANHRLHDIDQMKSDFVALVSHELRAPLATLNGGIEVALQHADDLPLRARRVLYLVMGETQRLTQFVQTILDVSQLEAGKLQLNCGPLAVAPMLRRAIEIVFGPDDPRIVWRVAPGLPPAWADETYVEEAIRNLLRNAQKYTAPQSPIEIVATIGDHGIQVSVTDHGPGIPQEAQKRVFERFYRVGQSDERAPRGWGLGLHFARSLLEAQGGALTLESPAYPDLAAPGSRFIAELPIAEEVKDDGEAAPY
jgi:signal transduction histidine kinase